MTACILCDACGALVDEARPGERVISAMCFRCYLCCALAAACASLHRRTCFSAATRPGNIHVLN
jgi:hypothetical protein